MAVDRCHSWVAKYLEEGTSASRCIKIIWYPNLVLSAYLSALKQNVTRELTNNRRPCTATGLVRRCIFVEIRRSWCFFLLPWLRLSYLICEPITFEHWQPLWASSAKQGATIRFTSPDPNNSNESHSSLDTISDVSMANKEDDEGRGGHIVSWQSENVIRPIQWCKSGLRWVWRSRGTAEILSTAHAISNRLYIHALLSSMLSSLKAKISVDLTSLLALSTSLKHLKFGTKKPILQRSVKPRMMVGSAQCTAAPVRNSWLTPLRKTVKPHLPYSMPPRTLENLSDQKKRVLTWGHL